MLEPWQLRITNRTSQPQVVSAGPVPLKRAAVDQLPARNVPYKGAVRHLGLAEKPALGYDCGCAGALGNAMLKALKLRYFRGFESYRLADLARVNLLVGKNNCGKTSVLEAVEFLVSGGRISLFRESAERRGELDQDLGYDVNVSHVFYGHRCLPGAGFELSSSGSQLSLEAKILSLDEIGEATPDWWSMLTKRRKQLDLDEEPAIAYGLSLFADGVSKVVLPIAENGALLDPFGPHTPSNGYSAGAARLLNFELSSMGKAWNDVLAEGRESEVVEAMRILMPEIDSIHFLAGRRRQGILVGQQGVKPRLPVGSYGDGMRRLLAISLALASTRDGCLLIDEIDTGLHWTVMEDMWRLVVETAQRSNVQVFATTHSFDCIKGLGTMIRSRSDLAPLVAIQRIHPSLKQAVAVPGEDVTIAVEQDIEVR